MVGAGEAVNDATGGEVTVSDRVVSPVAPVSSVTRSFTVTEPGPLYWRVAVGDAPVLVS